MVEKEFAPMTPGEMLKEVRRRPLTLEMIQKINASWKIPADLLVQPYRIAATSA